MTDNVKQLIVDHSSILLQYPVAPFCVGYHAKAIGSLCKTGVSKGEAVMDCKQSTCPDAATCTKQVDLDNKAREAA